MAMYSGSSPHSHAGSGSEACIVIRDHVIHTGEAELRSRDTDLPAAGPGAWAGSHGSGVAMGPGGRAEGRGQTPLGTQTLLLLRQGEAGS